MRPRSPLEGGVRPVSASPLRGLLQDRAERWLEIHAPRHPDLLAAVPRGNPARSAVLRFVNATLDADLFADELDRPERGWGE